MGLEVQAGVVMGNFNATWAALEWGYIGGDFMTPVTRIDLNPPHIEATS